LVRRPCMVTAVCRRKRESKEAFRPTGTSNDFNPVCQAFPLSILTEIYLCRACSCHEILRMETPGQGCRDKGHFASTTRRGDHSLHQHSSSVHGGVVAAPPAVTAATTAAGGAAMDAAAARPGQHGHDHVAVSGTAHAERAWRRCTIERLRCQAVARLKGAAYGAARRGGQGQSVLALLARFGRTDTQAREPRLSREDWEQLLVQGGKLGVGPWTDAHPTGEQRHRPLTQRAVVCALFEQADGDRDGWISASELGRFVWGDDTEGGGAAPGCAEGFEEPQFDRERRALSPRAAGAPAAWDGSVAEGSSRSLRALDEDDLSLSGGGGGSRLSTSSTPRQRHAAVRRVSHPPQARRLSAVAEARYRLEVGDMADLCSTAMPSIMVAMPA
jgi:hypothetical protein